MEQNSNSGCDESMSVSGIGMCCRLVVGLHRLFELLSCVFSDDFRIPDVRVAGRLRFDTHNICSKLPKSVGIGMSLREKIQTFGTSAVFQHFDRLKFDCFLIIRDI